MTLESRYELLAKVGFLAVLTMLIVLAGNADLMSSFQAQFSFPK